MKGSREHSLKNWWGYLEFSTVSKRVGPHYKQRILVKNFKIQ